MGGSYRQCTECGKRALSIATRCPGCGRGLPAPAGPEDGPRLDLRGFCRPAPWRRWSLWRRRRMGLGGGGQPGDRNLLALDHLRGGFHRGLLRGGVRGGAGGKRRRAAHRARLDQRAAGAERARRLEAVLTPGDSVVAALERDWYRVALEGEVLGYVHRTTLVRPAQSIGASGARHFRLAVAHR